MTEINFNGFTYVGTAEGDHGVFTHSSGTVFEGQIAGGCACVGVVTYTSGDTNFVECDADGWSHGRDLVCGADGDTEYYRCEHGRNKEYAVLYADGTCYYNGKPCRADFAPFAALQAMVVPIKARPPPVPPQPPLSPPATASQSVPSAIVFGTRRSWRRPTPTRCALADSAISSLHGPRDATHGSCQPHAPRVQPGRRTGRKGALRMRHKPHAWCTPPPSRAAQWTFVRLRLYNHMPHALVERCGLRRAATLGFTHTPLARRRRASPPRFAPRTCTPAPSHGPIFDARSMRP
jgi:hypothetical protein